MVLAAKAAETDAADAAAAGNTVASKLHPQRFPADDSIVPVEDDWTNADDCLAYQEHETRVQSRRARFSQQAVMTVS